MNRRCEPQKISRRRLGTLAAVFLATGPTASGAQEGSYPTRAIKLLVPSPPGSMFDTVARSAALEAEKKLGQPIILDYKSGAGGTPAFVQTRNAAPDGYTLLIIGLSTIRQPILENVGYDGARDFSWIAGMADINFAVIVPADAPFKTWAEFHAWARANPDKVSYGAPSGLGNSVHMFVSEIASRDKVNWTAVPFRASNDCMTALLSGQLSFSVDTLLGAWPHEKAGKVRLLAMATSARVPGWPNVPTMQELGYNLAIDSPYGIGGPAHMPEGIVRKIQDAFRFAMEQPSVIAVLEKAGQKPKYQTTAEFTRFSVKAEAEQRALLTKYGFAKR